ncbi:hypothetical protein BDZ97DRAFT_1761337 [Flammula alnicola]|nr:hypothetical protein BDZ97DRAFT_1761337 [Flammula alnicola]
MQQGISCSNLTGSSEGGARIRVEHAVRYSVAGKEWNLSDYISLAQRGIMKIHSVGWWEACGRVRRERMPPLSRRREARILTQLGNQTSVVTLDAASVALVVLAEKDTDSRKNGESEHKDSLGSASEHVKFVGVGRDCLSSSRTVVCSSEEPTAELSPFYNITASAIVKFTTADETSNIVNNPTDRGASRRDSRR